MEHARHLTGHDAAGLHIAVKHGLPQAAQGEVLQLHAVGALLLLGDVGVGHLVAQAAHRGVHRPAGDHGVPVLGLEDGLLIVLVDGALLAHQQAGAHLGSNGTQGVGGQQLPSAGDAAGGDDGDVHRVHHLGHQGHGGGLAHVAAALGALGDHRVGAPLGHQLGQGHGGHHGDHLGARLLPGGDEAGGIAGAGGDNGHLLLRGDGGQLLHLGVHEHDVHAEGLIGEGAAAADALLEHLGGHAARADEAQSAGVGHGGGKLGGGDVGHTALDKGELDPQPFVQLLHVISPPYPATGTGPRPRSFRSQSPDT